MEGLESVFSNSRVAKEDEKAHLTAPRRDAVVFTSLARWFRAETG